MFSMFSSLSKALKDNNNPGQNAAGDAQGINAKAKMIKEYNDAVAPRPGARPAQPYQPSPADRVNPKAKYGSRPGEKRPDQLDVDGLPKLSKGAKIKKARIVMVHKGEAVLPKDRTKKAAKAGLTKGLQSL
jgi:hypothetical protein